MKMPAFALLLVALGAAGVAPRAEEPRWRLGEPEVVWRDPRPSDDRQGLPIGSLFLHPHGGFLLATQLQVKSFRIQRFASDWRELWSTDITWPGAGPWYGVQYVHVAILPRGHIVLSLTQALALLDPDGRLAWLRGAGRGQVERFARFDGFGAVAPSGDGFVVGGYSYTGARNEPACWTLQGVLARIGIDGRVRWRTTYRIPWRPGRPRRGGTPFAAAPLLARADGGAVGYVASAELGTDLWTIATLTQEIREEVCRGESPGAFVEVDRQGRGHVHRELGLSVATLRRRHPDLPPYVIIDDRLAGAIGGRLSVYDSELLWLGPHGQALYDLVMTLLPDEVMRRQTVVFMRAPPRVVIVPVVAAAPSGSDVLVLVRRPVGDPHDLETALRREGPFRSFLIVVGARGPTVVDEREMPPLRSVRLLPEQGIGYGLVENTVVRFALRTPAP